MTLSLLNEIPSDQYLKCIHAATSHDYGYLIPSEMPPISDVTKIEEGHYLIVFENGYHLEVIFHDTFHDSYGNVAYYGTGVAIAGCSVAGARNPKGSTCEKNFYVQIKAQIQRSFTPDQITEFMSQERYVATTMVTVPLVINSTTSNYEWFFLVVDYSSSEFSDFCAGFAAWLP